MQALKLLSLAVFIGLCITGCNDSTSDSNTPVSKQLPATAITHNIIFDGASGVAGDPITAPLPGKPLSVNNQADFEKLWLAFQPVTTPGNSPPPVLDFSQGQAVFINAGSFSHGGNTLALSAVSQQADHALVTTHLSHLAPGLGSTTVITRPLIVAYIKTLLPISFQNDETVYADAQSLDSINNHGDRWWQSPTTEKVSVIQDKASLTAAAQSKYASLSTEALQAIEQVNFAQGQVILLDMGVFSTGGQALHINPKIETVAGKGDLNVTYHYAGKNCLVTMSFENPYQFVYIPSKATINVEIDKQTTDCPR